MIKERIDKFCRSYKPADKADKGLKDDQLSRTHWHQLDRVHDCLKVFEVTTLNTEDHRHWFCDWFPTLDFMLHTVGQFKTEFAEEAAADKTFEYLSDCCEHAWHKVEKYYKLADETPMVYAAVMLNPTMKLQWFKEHWTEPHQSQRLHGVTEQVRDLWHSSTFDPLQWWYHLRNVTPALAKFAFDTLALPLQSDDPERSFSAGRDMITYRRSNLLDDIIQAAMCLRSWYGPPKPKKKKDGVWTMPELDSDDEEEAEQQYYKAQNSTEAEVDNEVDLLDASSGLSDEQEVN
ncbi:hypothetical protein LTR22_026442 [Elasticomyces elasticus]|nr:hypothetical protein LTR22_026442 [Elasticomyces elasticus]KAK4899352.1 hypothetical protein LTR49_027643 [Elasticomyces elasticus]